MQWGFAEAFANRTNYLLEMLFWQNSYDPKKKAEHMAAKPKLFIPEHMKSAMREDGAEPHTVDEIKDILSRPRK